MSLRKGRLEFGIRILPFIVFYNSLQSSKANIFDEEFPTMFLEFLLTGFCSCVQNCRTNILATRLCKPSKGVFCYFRAGRLKTTSGEILVKSKKVGKWLRYKKVCQIVDLQSSTLEHSLLGCHSYFFFMRLNRLGFNFFNGSFCTFPIFLYSSSFFTSCNCPLFQQFSKFFTKLLSYHLHQRSHLFNADNSLFCCSPHCFFNTSWNSTRSNFWKPWDYIYSTTTFVVIFVVVCR